MVRCTGRGGAEAASRDEPTNHPRAHLRHAERNPTDHAPAAAFGPLLHRPPAGQASRGRGRGPIADGATIDEITARIRAEGETCSRSAGVGRYTKNMRDMIRQQQETDRTIKAWMEGAGRAPGGPGGARADRGPADHGALHHGQSQRAGRARVDGGARPASPLTLKRIEGTDKLRLNREQAAKKAAQGRRPGQAPGRGSRRRPSPSSVRRWRAGPRHRHPACSPHRHVGAGGPVEPCRSPPIPINPS